MKQFTYSTENVWSTTISFEIEDGILHNLCFTDGCQGNLQAISKLCEGQHIAKLISLLKGVDCDGKGTSCADQLAKALELVQSS
jgi:uncharacterized protein (TIGR03905 family)